MRGAPCGGCAGACAGLGGIEADLLDAAHLYLDGGELPVGLDECAEGCHGMIGGDGAERDVGNVGCKPELAGPLLLEDGAHAREASWHERKDAHTSSARARAAQQRSLRRPSPAPGSGCRAIANHLHSHSTEHPRVYGTPG